MMSQQSTYTLLPHIHFPADLRKLRLEDLPILCKELRENILDELAQNPGHLASSLGAIELTVALHYVFNTPEDRIVWDVGHQAYGHKILTGRREQFHTNRQLGGISPFPSPKESEYDTFVCGHASNAISAALGMSVAAFKKGQHERNVVAIIGDGAMSGGLAFEGLNNTSETPNNLLIILNDNNMSISDSVGGMKRYLHQVHTSSFYNRWRNKLAKKLEHWGWLNSPRKKSLIRFNNAVKSLISAQQNIFEVMNIRYFGPTDGHNVLELVRILRRLKNMQGPKLLHLKTIKGKGYDLAEENPIVWHAPGKFNRAEGERIENNENNQPPKFQDVFGETLVELAKQNPLIVGVTPAMLTGCSMCILAEQMPDRCFDVGIAEGHATTFSSGMAKDGLIPFCNIYSSFAQRAYDNIIHDTAILALPVIFCLDRAGLVGEDGPTHHGTFDIAALRPIPNLTIASPLDEHELRRLMYTAQLPNKGPFVIRYPRGGGRLIDWKCPLEEIEVGKGRVLKQGDGTIALISFGPIGMIGADAITEIEKTHPSANISHIDLRFVKPLDKTLILSVAQTHRHIVTLEDGVRNGGVGSAILELLSDHGIMVSVERIGLPDKFIEHGAVSELHRLCQTDKIAIIATLTRLLTNS